MQARNSVGYSLDSEELLIMAASVPDIPTDVVTVHESGYIVTSWTAPYNGGSPITGYHVLIQQGDLVLFSDD